VAVVMKRLADMADLKARCLVHACLSPESGRNSPPDGRKETLTC
jgi:hypothetical protein